MDSTEQQPENTTEKQTPSEALQKSREAPKGERKDSSSNDNVVFIGNKRIMNYVNSISMQLSKEENSDVIIKARRKFITKAADIVEVDYRRFQEEGIKINDIKIGTEEYENEGKKIRVSTIDITISK